MSDQKIRVRYAPSPTGFLHIGGLRTALTNELFAKKHYGDFILRIEDTDRARLVEGGIENMCRSLDAIGVIPNEGVWLDEKGNVLERGAYGPYIQSQRKERHQTYIEKLLNMDKAYVCFCSQERLEQLREQQQIAHQPTMYDGRCRSISLTEARKRIAQGEAYVVRLKLPRKGSVSFQDIIRGKISFEWALIDDQIILKTDGFPTYHLAATCDDHDMHISHVIRGEEWISSTPKHVFIYQSFGWDLPQFAHLPLLLNADRSKLSKRQGDVAVEDYLAKGYLPQALLNFVALLGWNPSADQEIYSHDELIQAFQLESMNKAGAIFNIEKLDWLNEHYLRNMSVEDYLSLTAPFIAEATDDHAFADRALLLIRDRVRLPLDVQELTRFLFQTEYDFSRAALTWKTQSTQEAKERLHTVHDILLNLSDQDFEAPKGRELLEKKIKTSITERGWTNGEVLWPLRVALSGQEKSPGPFELLETYGKKRSLERIEHALRCL